ncbi:hypothetical protein AY536_04360 [Corynebacterium diphtheriae bv. mitis]|nr:hypothetical protein AY473_02895 [Corynebacterium diphtheriae bv. mitis]OWO26601.1 hypothetical protein AY536_04360 [Corynebacterium diphtheriae bv. mitis]
MLRAPKSFGTNYSLGRERGWVRHKMMCTTRPQDIIIAMSKFSEVLDQLRENQPQAKYGIAFEKLMVNYLCTDWRYNGGKPDTGGCVL